jgi:sugar phosphate isomerase/epimerase
MFKTAVFTDEISQDIDTAIKVTMDFNLEGVELRTVKDRQIHTLNKNELKEIKFKLDDAGLKVCCIASPFFKCNIENEKEIKDHINILNRSIDAANYFGTKIIRGFTFWRTGVPEKYFDMILDRFSKPADIVKKAKVVLAIENEHATYIGTGKLLARFLKTINSPYIKAVFDAANEIHDPDGEAPFPTAYRWIKDFTVHIHIKDAVKISDNGKPACMAVGEGQINYWGLLKELKDSCYSGYISLETHWRGFDKQLSEKQINKPGGKSFSENAEHSSRYCLKNIKRIISSI